MVFFNALNGDKQTLRTFPDVRCLDLKELWVTMGDRVGKHKEIRSPYQDIA